MGTAIKFVWGATWRILAFCAVVGAGLWWMNRSTGWDANSVINSKENYVKGRAGLIVVGLAQPERYEPKFFENFLDKVFTQVIPWPINVLAGADTGIVLMDPSNAYAPKRFEPKQLADIWGRTSDVDGMPWIEKYRKGELRWEKASASTPFDTGVFLYPARKQGMRFAAAKTAAKARYIYYARLPQGILPHYRQTVDMAKSAIAIANQSHPLVAAEFADAFDKGEKEAAVRMVLDSGVDTLILASALPIHSNFEELRGSFAGVYKIAEAWRSEHGGKPVRYVVAPWLAGQPAFDEMWLRHFEKVTPKATAPGQSAMGIITLHGLPVSLIDGDSWSKRVPIMVARLKPKMEAILKAKGYSDIVVTPAQEAFGDTAEDPDDHILSVSESFARARKEGRALAIALPVEFLAENTDTLFAHAAFMFDGLPGYESYQGPPAGTNWSEPYVRRFQSGKTLHIYAGTPGGNHQAKAAEALASSISSVFGKPQ